MALYSRPVRLLMHDMAEELSEASNPVFTKSDAIQWFAKNYPKIKPATVSAHLIRLSTNARSRHHFNAKVGEDDLLFQIDGSHFRLYRPGDDPKPLRGPASGGSNHESLEDTDDDSLLEESQASNGEFAYEADLRNYLQKNLGLLEPGLRLYEDEGILGIEFPVGGRFIDILAVDNDENLVVIELKVSKGYDRVVGQLMRYVAWIKENLAEENQGVRGIIVGREISKDLLLACSLVPSVELFEYQLSLAIQKVESKGD